MSTKMLLFRRFDMYDFWTNTHTHEPGKFEPIQLQQAELHCVSTRVCHVSWRELLARALLPQIHIEGSDGWKMFALHRKGEGEVSWTIWHKLPASDRSKKEETSSVSGGAVMGVRSDMQFCKTISARSIGASPQWSTGCRGTYPHTGPKPLVPCFATVAATIPKHTTDAAGAPANAHLLTGWTTAGHQQQPDHRVV